MAMTTSLFFSLACSIFIIVAQQATAQNYHCFNDKGNYTLNSKYHDNLNYLLITLPSSQNDNGYGFYNLSSGNASNQVFAIGLCDGDTMPDVCRSCLNKSTHLLQEVCPNQKEAVAWLDKCMLRYSNRSLYGIMETRPNIIINNTQNVSSDSDTVEAYFKALRSLIDNLKSRAAAGGSLRKFSVDNVTTPGFKTIYGLVQCTPDLSLIDCNNCLDDAFEVFPGCCNKKNGGEVLGTSCKYRYEDYLFYNSTAAEVSPPSPLSQRSTASPPSPLTTHETKNNASSSRTVLIVVIGANVVLGIVISICVGLRLRKAMILRKTNHLSNEPVEEILSVESLQYNFDTIKLATDNFSEENKLGHGGFGAVYWGKLSHGEIIAVKKLHIGSAQGDLEFKNEVMLVAKLQHRNLVRILGFSLEGSERLLVYEFVQNGSLDHFIFDPRKRVDLDWDRRYKIIGGVARGILYLHEDSRLRIIHRDIKASNILLDDEMNPKISDFGCARLFVDQAQDNTNRIVGTYGYMAPEYAMRGQFSIKSDVFSFGVLLLEMISGQNINNFHQGGLIDDLLSCTWTHWREGIASEMVDPLMRVGSGCEIMRCIHIGLLCVQENLVDRPTMNTIVLMLNSNSTSLPLPSKPAFFMHSNMGSDISTFPLEFNSRMNVPKRESVNEGSITELFPR
ncbi:cysteine-rich receptor-like protein kinase 44 [Humulus lupulus]|uniref:cysteine-rich receptor-like protein kinase 44 n=1 Tax=Humulus lupulus TaxID=3486 RepID=UPI002B40D9FA|nr:cysteine-rich receptor-like protein kinase 44 [Humulus lupulus]